MTGVVVVNGVVATICVFAVFSSTYAEIVQITNDDGHHPRFSPDGSKIAYTLYVGDTPQLFIVDINGDNKTHVETGMPTESHLCWNREGTRLLFDARTTGGTADIYSVPIEGGTPTRLAVSPDGHEFNPYCFPDSNRMAYTKMYMGLDRIAFAPISGGPETEILATSWLTRGFCLSPDGTQIAFCATQGDWTDNNYDIFTMPVTGGTPFQLTTATSREITAAWSPDGTTILFTSDRAGDKDLWVIPAEGGTPVQLTDMEGYEHYADWSPDGSKIAFAGTGGIFVMDYPFYESCCGKYNNYGVTGNTNCSTDGKVTLSDITTLIDHVYISKQPLCCQASGNTNGSTDCKTTLSDITQLIDTVYITKSLPAVCMSECEQ